MNPPSPPERPFPLLGVTIRRSLYVGRIYLGAGTGLSLFYAVVFALAGQSAFDSVFPLLLPVMAVIGGMGGVLVFTNDRLKGVFEYLLAYGIPPRQIVVNSLVASLVQVTIVLGAAVAGGLLALVATGHEVSLVLVRALVGYSFPMGFAAVSFAGISGMLWTSLSSPREGINSPVGLVPILAVVPPTTVLLLAVVRPASAVPIVFGALVVLVVVVLGMLNYMGRLMRPERLLSPT